MNDRVFDAVARRAAQALDRRSLLGLFSGAALAAAAPSQRTIASKDHHHHPDGGGGGGSGNNDKDKRCEKEGKSYAKLLDGVCIATYFYNLIAAASCAACFDVCANHLKNCKPDGAKGCTEDCGRQYGISVHLK